MTVFDSKIEEKRQERASRLQDAQDLKDTWEKEDREPTTAEDERWSDLMDEIDRLEEDIEDLEEKQREASSLDELQDDPILTGENGRGELDEDRDLETLRWSAHIKQRLQRATGQRYPLTDAEDRALSADIDEEGGFAVAPQQFVEELIKFVDDELFMRDLARVETVEGTDSLGAPSLDQDPSDADWTSEVGSISEDSQMDFGARELNPHQLTKRLLVSRKLLRTSALDIDQLVRERLGYKFMVTEEKGYLSGSGASQPLGVFTASSDGISTSRDVSEDMNTDSITTDGLIAVKHSLKAQYQRTGTWLFHRDAIKQIRKLKDGSGQYIWDPAGQLGLTEDAPGTILGRPYFMSEFVPNTFTSGSYVGILGDFSQYWIALSMEMEVQVLQELYAENSQVGFIGRMWADGMPVLEEAFARVTLA